MLELTFIAFLASSSYLQAQDNCLAVALHNEARNQHKQGQRAVIDVIYNRSLASFSSPCTVIKKPHQFSFVTKQTNWQADDVQMERLMKVKNVKRVLDFKYQYYHTNSISPVWSRKMKGKRVIGNHTFMKEK